MTCPVLLYANSAYYKTVCDFSKGWAYFLQSANEVLRPVTPLPTSNHHHYAPYACICAVC